MPIPLRGHVCLDMASRVPSALLSGRRAATVFELLLLCVSAYIDTTQSTQPAEEPSAPETT